MPFSYSLKLVDKNGSGGNPVHSVHQDSISASLLTTISEIEMQLNGSFQPLQT